MPFGGDVHPLVTGRNPALYTLREASELLRRNPQTIRNWIKEGKIKAFRDPDSTRSRIYITADEMRAYFERNTTGGKP